MKVSVVVPLYNKRAHILRCLHSIASQTLSDFEAVVVDDGSTDGSGEVARTFPDPRFRVVTQPNAGPGAARNRGANEASAPYLAFLDADDEWAPTYLAESIAALEESGDQVAATSAGYLDAGVDLRAMWESRRLKDGVFRAQASTSAELLVYTTAFMSPWNTVMRRGVFEELGGFYSRTRALFAEDAWLMVQILLRYPVRIRLSPPLVLFHREASELSHNLTGKRPVEPFLSEPEPVQGACPPAMRPLLRQFLAFRALKTACALGYWGDWRTAAMLRKRFVRPGDIRLPYYWTSLVCSTPLAAWLGALLRTCAPNMRLTQVSRARAAAAREPSNHARIP